MRSTTRWRRWPGRPRTRARPARARSGQVGQPGGEQPTGWRSQNQADDDEGQCHREFVPTALPRCWPAGQSGHAGHGVRWMAGDFCRQRSIHRRRAGGSSNGARYPRSFRPAGCIGPRNGICAKSLSCLLVAGTLPSACYFAPNICSSPPSWLDRQRAAPFLKEWDTNGPCASAWRGPRSRMEYWRGDDRSYSGLMPALRTTLPHFSVSAAM